jgi:hypothetical protein
MRFWVKHDVVYAVDNLNMIQVITQNTTVMQKETVKGTVVWHILDVSEDIADIVFTFCLRQKQSGLVRGLWAASDEFVEDDWIKESSKDAEKHV